MPSNQSLQSTCNYVLTQIRGAPLQDVLGVQNEPAVSLCNDTYQEVLQRPLTWRFNKANAAGTGLGVLYFTTQQYQQDYPCTNATASTPTPTPGSPNPPNGGSVHIATVYNNGISIVYLVNTVTTEPIFFGLPQTVNVSSTANIAINGKLAIDVGPNQEIVTVTNVGAGTFTATFANDHFTGVNVWGTGTATVTTTWPHNFAVGQTATLLNVGQWVAGVFTPTPLLNQSWTIFAIVGGVQSNGISTSMQYTFTGVLGPTPGSGIYGAPGINDIGWIERCVLEDWASTGTVKPRHSIEVTMNLELESIIQPPYKISYQYSQTDAGLATGQLIPSTTAVFRLWPVPSSQIWGQMIDYQLKPITFTSLDQTWGVWPDELMFVIRQGLKAFALDFVEDPRAQFEYQLFQTRLDQVRDIRDQEKPSQTFFPDRPIMFGG